MKQKARSSFVIMFWIAFLIYLVGMTYLMSDIEARLGKIEHYMAHQVYDAHPRFQK